MENHNVVAQRAERAAVAAIQRELGELDGMTTAELAEKYHEVFGTPTRTHNKGYLRKHIAWRIQERLEGGLSPRALDRIAELAPQAPARWRRAAGPPGADETPASAVEGRDPRLPAVGNTISRLYAGVEHTVTVLERGFEYQGEPHRTLSGIARLITGQSWNGFIFFFGRDGISEKNRDGANGEGAATAGGEAS